MVTDAGVARAREWLRRNQLDHIEPSTMLVDRLAARRRGNWIYAGTLAVFWAVLVAVIPDDPNAAGNLAFIVLNNVFLLLAMAAGLWYATRAERRLVLASRIRTAHPAAPRAARVLGSRYLAAVLAVYVGGLLLGTVTALLAPRPADRGLALAFLGSVAVLTIVSGLALAGVLRRPSVAEDSDSLLVDDVLRAQDARAAVMPFPIVVAVIAAVGGTVGPWLVWSFLAYAALGAACWAAVAIACRRAGRTVKVAQ